MQETFDFTAPVQTQGSLRTRHSSAMGARDVSERIGRQMLVLLTAYRQYGDLTDAEASDRTGLMRSSIIPRRRELIARGLVEEKGHRRNERSGVTNTVFGLAR